MNVLELSEQEIVRRESLAKMREMGIDPYPAAEYEVNGYTSEIKENSPTSLWMPKGTRFPTHLPARGECGRPCDGSPHHG